MGTEAKELIMIELQQTTKGELYTAACMESHYSNPRGFCGRQVLYVIKFDGLTYGIIGFGSAIKHLPGRYRAVNELNHGINNTIYHVNRINGEYPIRNFTVKTLLYAESTAKHFFESRYGDEIKWFESLVELPRTGELYRRAGYSEVGLTKGFTCKRTAGESSDSWTGKRVWSVGAKKRVFIKTL